jgi:peptide/nickel transport system substrate-binding protein
MKGPTMKRRLLLALPALIRLGRPAFAAEKTLTVGAAVFPDSLRSGTGSYASLSLLLQTNDALLARDNAGALLPSLAETWELVNPTTMRFHLRKGVKFHDGTDFTADDVVFSITRVMDPATAYGMRTRISQVASATAVDPYTVDIATKTVFPTLLRGLSEIVIEPRHYYDKVGADAVMAHPIGTGPFIFKEWVPGDHYTLTANKSYWGGVPHFENLIIRTIPDGSTRVASLVAGESQIIEEVPIDLIDEVNESDAAKVDEISTTVGLVLTFDPTIKPFDNPAVREAFDYAINKPLIFKEILKGEGELLQGQVLTKGVLGWNPDLKARSFDPAKARKMLQDAGYDFNTPVPITTMNGKYVSDTDICNAVAGMLNEIGVKATVNIVEGGVFQQMSAARKLGPLYMIGWYSVGDADFAAGWYTKAGLRTWWSDPEYERLFVAARSTINTDERIKDYHRMMEILYQQNPSIFLFGLPSLYGVNKSISGFGAAADKLLRLTKVTTG